MKNKIVIKKVVVDKNGKRYLPIEKCGISPLCLMIDGISYTTFEGEKKHYISIERIIEWFKQEIKHFEKGEPRKRLEHNLKFMEELNILELNTENEKNNRFKK